MLDAAFFISPELHQRPVELPDGSKYTLHFRELAVSQMRAYQLAQQAEDEEVRAGAVAKLIAFSVCEPDGTPALTYEKALTLRPLAANALMAVIYALNGEAGTQAKKPLPSEETAGSGTSSPSRLAVAA